MAYGHTEHFVALVGDVNLCTDSMRVDPQGTPHLVQGPRLAQWNSRIDMHEIRIGLTHVNTGANLMSGIDKVFVNISETCVEMA
eukprot:6480275-Amphidinium_carterae.1